MNVDVSTRGPVPPDMARLAAEKVGEVDTAVDEPLGSARVVLHQEQNPRILRPARAEGEVQIRRAWVRARVEAESMTQAINGLSDRLRRQLRRHLDRLTTRGRVPPTVATGEWRRGAWVPPRPPRSWRAPGEREVIRRKQFTMEPMSATHAAEVMVDLDHAFFLFFDADTQTDAVVYLRDDGRLGVIAPQDAATPTAADVIVHEPSRYSEPLTLQDAISEMDVLNHRFLFFTDATTGRGAVLYLRYDGHYGLIEPAT